MSKEDVANCAAFADLVSEFEQSVVEWAGLGVRPSGSESSHCGKQASAIADRIQRICGDMQKLYHTPVQVAFLGTFSGGKSSIINGIIRHVDPDVTPPQGESMSPHDVVVTILKYGASAPARLQEHGDNYVLVKTVPSRYLEEVNLIDTPGSGDDAHRDKKLNDLLSKCDFIFFVLSPTHALGNAARRILHRKFDDIPAVEMRFIVSNVRLLAEEAGLSGRQSLDTIRALPATDQWLANTRDEYIRRFGSRLPMDAYDLVTSERCFLVETKWDVGIAEIVDFIDTDVRGRKDEVKESRFRDFAKAFDRLGDEYIDTYRRVASRTDDKLGELEDGWRGRRRKLRGKIDKLDRDIRKRVADQLGSTVDGSLLSSSLRLDEVSDEMAAWDALPSRYTPLPASSTAEITGQLDDVFRGLVRAKIDAAARHAVEGGIREGSAGISALLAGTGHAESSRASHAAVAEAVEKMVTGIDKSVTEYYHTCLHVTGPRGDGWDHPKYEAALQAISSTLAGAMLVDALPSASAASGLTARGKELIKDQDGLTEELGEAVREAARRFTGNIEASLLAQQAEQIDASVREVTEAWQNFCGARPSFDWEPLRDADEFARSAIAGETGGSASPLEDDLVQSIVEQATMVRRRLISDVAALCNRTASKWQNLVGLMNVDDVLKGVLAMLVDGRIATVLGAAHESQAKAQDALHETLTMIRTEGASLTRVAEEVLASANEEAARIKAETSWMGRRLLAGGAALVVATSIASLVGARVISFGATGTTLNGVVTGVFTAVAGGAFIAEARWVWQFMERKLRLDRETDGRVAAAGEKVRKACDAHAESAIGQLDTLDSSIQSLSDAFTTQVATEIGQFVQSVWGYSSRELAATTQAFDDLCAEFTTSTDEIVAPRGETAGNSGRIERDGRGDGVHGDPRPVG